jgi:hypothetical protein
MIAPLQLPSWSQRLVATADRHHTSVASAVLALLVLGSFLIVAVRTVRMFG